LYLKKGCALNIVFVNPEYPTRTGHDHGGIATYIYSMANALAGEGHSVYILSKSQYISEYLHPNIKLHVIKHKQIKRLFPTIDKLFHRDDIWERGYSLAAKEEIININKKESVDCVEIPEFNGLAYEFNQPLPFPVIIHFHTPTYLVDFYNQKKISCYQLRWHKLEEKALKRAQAFRCPSNSLKKEICNHYKIKEELITVIPHPIDTTVFDAIKKKDRSENVIHILFTGRLERRKGGDILLRDIPRILRMDKKIQITIAGELEMGDAGSYRNAIERSISEEERHRLWLLGPIKRRELSVLYKNSDIFIMPSLFENAPYSLLEAMASKLAIVATNTGGICELIHNKENGILFDISDNDGLINAIKEIIDYPEKSKQYGEKAYETIINICSPKEVVKKSIEFYLEVINSFNKNKKSNISI
jgi:glycosyltransferase involved in cell wall biosynthesis